MLLFQLDNLVDSNKYLSKLNNYLIQATKYFIELQNKLIVSIESIVVLRI